MYNVREKAQGHILRQSATTRLRQTCSSKSCCDVMTLLPLCSEEDISHVTSLDFITRFELINIL